MAETNQQLTQQFLTRFQAGTSALLGELELLRSGTPTKDVIDQLAMEAGKLRKDLTDAIAFIPSYDQRQCENKLKDVEAQVEALRVSAAPKSKFAFKRKAAKAAPTPSSAAPTPPTNPPKAFEAPSGLPQEDSHSSGLSLSGHSYSYLTVSSLSAPWSAASDLTIADLDHCVVNLIPSPANPDAPAGLAFNALHVRNITNSVLMLPVIPGSALLHDMKNCVIALGSRQFRMHTSSQVDVYISIGSNPIIEHCSAIRFADYPSSLKPSPTNASQGAKSNYLAVQDFSHIRATPSPNWSALPDDRRIPSDRWPVSRADTKEILQSLLPTP